MKKSTKLILGLAGAAGAYAGASYAVVRGAMSMVFGRTGKLRHTTGLWYDEIEARYPGRYTRTPVEFPSGDLMLKGYVYGEDHGKGLIIFSHGIYSGHELYISGILELVEKGYQVLGFDNTGCYESPGENSRGLIQGPLDLAAALDFVQCNRAYGDLPRFLMGHSWGGYSVCAVLNFGYQVDGILSVSGFSDPMEVTLEMGQSMFGPAAGAVLPMMRLEYRRRFGENADLNAIRGINRVETPILIMHGAGDDYVNYNGSAIIHHKDEITNPNVQFMPLDYPLRNGHNDIFLSEEAKKALDEFDERLKAPLKEHKAKGYWDLPDEIQDELFLGLDRDLTSRPNKELFDEVDHFFTECLVRKDNDRTGI